MMQLLKDAPPHATGIVIIHVDGRVEFKELEDTGEVRLSDMQEAVGGMIEPIPGTDYHFWCNENGMAEGLEPNAAVPGILGNVLLCGIGGDMSIPLSATEYRTILHLRGMTTEGRKFGGIY